MDKKDKVLTEIVKQMGEYIQSLLIRNHYTEELKYIKIRDVLQITSELTEYIEGIESKYQTKEVFLGAISKELYEYQFKYFGEDDIRRMINATDYMSEIHFAVSMMGDDCNSSN